MLLFTNCNKYRLGSQRHGIKSILYVLLPSCIANWKDLLFTPHSCTGVIWHKAYFISVSFCGGVPDPMKELTAPLSRALGNPPSLNPPLINYSYSTQGEKGGGEWEEGE